MLGFGFGHKILQGLELGIRVGFELWLGHDVKMRLIQ